MNRKLQLAIIICTVTLITAIITHGIISWLRIETTFGSYWVTGQGGGKPSVFMAGSSLAGDGLSWWRIGDALNMRIGGWGVAGSSPSEWERYQNRAVDARMTVIVISPYDLNEYFLSDFRSEVVPFGQTIRDLWESGADWSFSKRLLSQYPLTYLRILYPTVGRSEGVMAGGRDKLKNIVGKVFHMESEAGPTLSLGDTSSIQEVKKEKISDWYEGRMLRRLANMRSACQGLHAYNGPKRLAFRRMLDRAKEQGNAIVVVLPVSPAYAGEFLSLDAMRGFEEELADLQRAFPEAHWIRLDQMDELRSNEYFWDLVHMNAYGQQIATDALLGQLKKISGLP